MKIENIIQQLLLSSSWHGILKFLVIKSLIVYIKLYIPNSTFYSAFPKYYKVVLSNSTQRPWVKLHSFRKTMKGKRSTYIMESKFVLLSLFISPSLVFLHSSISAGSRPFLILINNSGSRQRVERNFAHCLSRMLFLLRPFAMSNRALNRVLHIWTHAAASLEKSWLVGPIWISQTWRRWSWWWRWIALSRWKPFDRPRKRSPVSRTTTIWCNLFLVEAPWDGITVVVFLSLNLPEWRLSFWLRIFVLNLLILFGP